MCCGHNWIFNSQWTCRGESYSSVFLSSFIDEKISLKISLYWFSSPRMSQEFFLGSNPLFFPISSKVLLQISEVPFLSPFSLFKWENPLGDFLCSSFLNNDFASYFTPWAALAICCIVTSLGWAAWLLTLSWHMALLVSISLLFLTKLDGDYDSLSPISCSLSASSPECDLSSS